MIMRRECSKQYLIAAGRRWTEWAAELDGSDSFPWDTNWNMFNTDVETEISLLSKYTATYAVWTKNDYNARSDV